MRQHWKKILWAGLCLLSLAGFLLLKASDRRTTETLTPQLAAERWETAAKPYAMASVFLEPDRAIPAERMGEIRLSVENALTAGGVGSEDHPWLYTASYHRDAVLKNGPFACPVELTAVTGDFFQVHPLPVLSGWYMADGDLMHDRIVLDRQTAWTLFYSPNVAGQFITLDGFQYEIAAVVDLEPGTYNRLAGGDICRAWVLADSPALVPSEGLPAAGYTCMEVILPQPVKNFAASTLKSALGDLISDTTPITDNSGRFSLPGRWNVLRHLATRGISAEAVPYPYWENAARLAENHLALRLIPEALLLLFPAVSLCILLLWLNHRRTWGLHSIRTAAENALDRKHQRDYAARLGGQSAQGLPGSGGPPEALRYTDRGRNRHNKRP